jgi:hypothetical protein
MVALNALVGRHLLTGHGEFINNKYPGLFSDNARVVLLRLDGDICAFAEDPDDGYRSALGTVTHINDGDIPPGAFTGTPVVLVNCQLKNGEVLVGTDSDGHEWFRVGTDRSDGWYPAFVGEWYPPEPE